MQVQTHTTTYIMGASDALMDKVRAEANAWAEGDDNICMTFEDAMEVEELTPLLRNITNGGDVILSY